MQVADEPPYLTVGTDVSAKYKGAFCEAKIKKVNRFVKCKVTFKNNQGTVVVSDDQVRGPLRVGASVEAKHPEKTQYMEATIAKLLDYSQYTVVFDDGDETTLRRSSLCLKSGRHFAESESLDQLPLTNPEHFGTPVIGSKSRRKRRSAALNISIDDDSSEDEGTSKRFKEGKHKDPDLGKVVCLELGDKRKRDLWFPALVVAPLAHEGFKINPKEEYLVRSFKDGKYYQVSKKETKSFTKEMESKMENSNAKAAVDKAQMYLDHNQLPPHWDRDLLIGASVPSAEEDSHESDSDTSDDEPSEDKDRFVAQLYKFMDEHGTPINRAPTVGNRDLNLYKLFKIVQKMGGYNRATNQNQWKTVFTRMGLPNSTHSSLQQLKQAYKKYLHSFEDFFRKLGCTMVTNTRSNRVRHRSDRNLMMTRNRDRDLSASRARLQMRESKEKLQKREEKSIKVETEKEEEKVRIPRTRTSCREPEGESSKDAEARQKEVTVDSSLEKKETRQSIKQEVDVDEKKTSKRHESEDETEKSKDRTPKQSEKTKKKVKEKKEKSVEVKKKPKVGLAKEEDEKISVPKGASPPEKFKKKRTERIIKKEPNTESDASSDRKDVSNSEDEDGKTESTDSDKKGRDSSVKKQMKKKMKPKEEDMDDNGSRDSEDEKDSDINEQACSSIEIGDKLKVKYGKGKQLKIYEAKVIKIEDSSVKPYFVHYTGWNVRYDEWIRRSRIVDNTTKSQAKRKKSALKASTPKIASKRNRSNSISPTTSSQVLRKSSTPPSQNNSRHTRSEKSNLFSGLEPRKRARRKSGMSNTDPQASDNESGETSDAGDSLEKSVKEEFDQPESLPAEDEDEGEIDEKPAMNIEEAEEETNLIKEPDAIIKTEPLEVDDIPKKIETEVSSESLLMQKQEEAVESEEEVKSVSPTNEVLTIVAEETLPLMPLKKEADEVILKDITSTRDTEEATLVTTTTDESKIAYEKLLEENLMEDTDNEEDVLNSSFEKSEEIQVPLKEQESEACEVTEMNESIQSNVKVGPSEELSEAVESSPKESDMCSFVSKLEEIEQCEDSKANIEKLINDLESSESCNTSPNDSESEVPKFLESLPVKEEYEDKVTPAVTVPDTESPNEDEHPSLDTSKDDECHKLQGDTKKEGKKKKKVPKLEKKAEVEDDSKADKLKSKKRQKHEDQEDEGKHKNKKLKKNKGKKKPELSSSSEIERKPGSEGEHTKKKEKKRREDRKPFGIDPTKSGDKKEKRKGKKNKEKLLEKKSETFGEKKTKKKRKGHNEALPEADSDKGIETDKHTKTLKRKKGKKSKPKEDLESKPSTHIMKKDRKLKLELLETWTSASSSDQQVEDDDIDKDLSFLLCEEKVPASPVGDTSPDNDESSDSKPLAEPFAENNPGNYSGFAISCLVKTMEKHEEVATVLDNTPPTTPESTDSALLGTPPHERENLCMDFVSRDTRSYLHESQKGDNLESEDTAESTLSSHSGSDNDRQESSKSFLKRQVLEAELVKKSKKNKRSSCESSTLRSKQKMIGKVKDSKEILMKAAESSDSEESQRLSSSCLFSPSLMGLGQVSNISTTQSNRPSKFNFYVPLDDYTDADKRISILQEKLSELRKVYMGLKAEVALIDRRRKKAKKKEKEAGNCTSSNNSSSHGPEQQLVHHPS